MEDFDKMIDYSSKGAPDSYRRDATLLYSGINGDVKNEKNTGFQDFLDQSFNKSLANGKPVQNVSSIPL